MRKSILREEKEYIQITSIDEIDFTHPEIVAALGRAYATLLKKRPSDEQAKRKQSSEQHEGNSV